MRLFLVWLLPMGVAVTWLAWRQGFLPWPMTAREIPGDTAHVRSVLRAQPAPAAVPPPPIANPNAFIARRMEWGMPDPLGVYDSGIRIAELSVSGKTIVLTEEAIRAGWTTKPPRPSSPKDP